MSEVDHPAHYGGKSSPYEAIKVIEAWSLGFCLGNAIKYIARAGKKGDRLTDLRKARWYLDREIANLEKSGVDTEVRRFTASDVKQAVAALRVCCDVNMADPTQHARGCPEGKKR